MHETPLPQFTETTYGVWVSTPDHGPTYAYRRDLIYSVACHWAASWNQNRPADVPDDATFVVVAETRSYAKIN